MENECQQKDEYRFNLHDLNAKIDKILDKSDSLSFAVQNLDGRIADIEEKQTVNVSVPSNSQSSNDNAHRRNTKIREPTTTSTFEYFSRDILDHSPDAEELTSVDCQEDFNTIKDCVQKIKLPPDLKLNESKQGIRRDDQQVLSVISRSAQYAETALKVLSTFDDGAGSESADIKLSQLIKIQQAQISYLRDEYANLIVQSKFDKSTSQTFRALQKNTSGLNAQALQNLKLASAISASASAPAREPTAPRRDNSTTNNWRGNYGGGGRRNFFRGRGRGYTHNNYSQPDSFEQLAQRGPPADHR